MISLWTDYNPAIKKTAVCSQKNLYYADKTVFDNDWDSWKYLKKKILKKKWTICPQF